LSGACAVSGRDCVKKVTLNGNKRIPCCAPGRISARLRSIMRAALAVVIVLLTSAGLALPATAQASTARVSTLAAPASSKAAIATAAARMRLRVWRYALAQRGKPYIWGGTGPYGFDCSGLVYAAYRAAGVMLPRTTYEMLRSWRLVRIPKSEAQQGDLAFFGTGHVELYDGGSLTYGAQQTGTVIGFHRMNAFWHPTMYFRVRL
jgi:cell wall-associated NlpC family hydrolase